MKAVILAAGKGIRLAPFTNTKSKVLLPVAGKPFLWFLIDNLKKAGIEDKQIGVVVGHKKEQLEAFLKKYNLDVTLIEQKEQLGTAHAVKQARDFVGSDEFIVLMGDNLYAPEDITDVKNCTEMCIAGAVHERPEQFGALHVEENYLKGISEKGKQNTQNSALVNTGLYKFTPKIFDFIDKLEKSQRGEYEITDAVSALAREGPVIVYKTKGYWLDFTYPWHVLDINEFLMDKIRTRIEEGADISDKATIKGNVMIEKGAEIMSNVHIEGPVYISKGCKIGPNCYLRAGTFLEENVRVGNGCEIKHSVVMRNTRIPHLSYVGDSVIGENCNLGAGTKVANLRFDDKHVEVRVNNERINSGRRKLGALIGDNVQTGINVSIMPGVVIKDGINIPPHTIVNRDVE